MKQCSKCNNLKPLTGYYRDKSRKDGHDSVCKECKSSLVKLRNNLPRMEGTKTCTKCGENKPVIDFSKDKSRKDGRSPHCKGCAQQASREHYGGNKEQYHISYRKRYCNNPELFHGRTRLWRKNNPEKQAVINRRARENNPDKFRQSSMEWKNRNPDKVYEQTARRRAIKEQAYPDWIKNSELYSFMLEEVYSLAQLRTKELGINFQVDHVVPLTAKSDF